MNYNDIYYEKNKENLKKLQREYYQKYKNDPTKSYFLEHRLKLQRDKYKEKNPNAISYNISYKKRQKYFYEIRFNHGLFIINFK